MSQRIFLSHNHNDKPLIEAVALRLAGIFGREQVFYDSWSIQPGDGIIDKMNNGLAAPEFVFFFVSRNSLESGMVKLEWQNALYMASQGKTKIIPVRVDGTEMPSVLKQTLFIDMHTAGLEAAIAQIVSVAQGNASFTPQHRGFSNLTHTRNFASDGSINITVLASHLLEPNPNFALLVANAENEVIFDAVGYGGYNGGFIKDGATLSPGTFANAMLIRPMNATLSPDFPMRFKIRQFAATPVRFIDILHQKSESDWISVPIDTSNRIF